MKKIQLTKDDLQSVLDFELVNFERFTSATHVSIDSRTITEGSIYVAIQGEKLDGHEFAKEAIKKGACAAVIAREKMSGLLLPKNFPVIIVDDTTLALGLLASLWRDKLNAKVISLTGSNGKTTTKDVLVQILSESYAVIGTAANNNNHIGVPLTILSANSDCEFLVLEHGTNHFDEIAYTASIARPDLAFITNIGASHLEYLKNLEGVKKEKVALLYACEKNNGTIFINVDDKLLKPLAKEFEKCITVGTKASADYSYKFKGYNKNGYPKVHIDFEEKAMEITVPLYGKHNASNLAAAVAIALYAGMSKSAITAGIKKVQPAKHRLVPIELKKALILDDTYNANPQSMLTSLDVLRNIKTYKNRWVILGDMFELGEQSEKLHKSIVPAILKNQNIRVFTLGDMMYSVFKELKKYYLPVWHFKDKNSLFEAVNETDFAHSAILIKGSRGMKMEEVVEAIVRKFEE
ncbi:MAG: UDP-N-acetylmuramoyl-tripeptide--D-alanyl-D-alanine ligase [Ignavibacteria bacterium]|nr:UDP-N-acetylmuramoyl-tripeptide--D-alanyl-D-alanine ligase [Ignavibacteria bacterium]